MDTENAKIVMVRTYSAGVHFGTLEQRQGKEVTLKNARRVWYWSGAASISQLATEGSKNPTGCKISVEVESIVLTEAIEIIEMTPAAIENLKSVQPWKM